MTSTKGIPIPAMGYVCHLSKEGIGLKKFRITAPGLVFEVIRYFNHLTVKEKLILLLSFIISLVNTIQMEIK